MISKNPFFFMSKHSKNLEKQQKSKYYFNHFFSKKSETFQNIFFSQKKNYILLVLTIEEISIRPELYKPP